MDHFILQLIMLNYFIYAFELLVLDPLAVQIITYDF